MDEASSAQQDDVSSSSDEVVDSDPAQVGGLAGRGSAESPLKGVNPDRRPDAESVSRVLSELETRAENSPVAGRPSDADVLGADPLGVRNAPAPLPGVKELDFNQLSAAQAMTLIDRVNMLADPPGPQDLTPGSLEGQHQRTWSRDWRPGEREYWGRPPRNVASESTPGRVEMPATVHTMWVGTPTVSYTHLTLPTNREV